MKIGLEQLNHTTQVEEEEEEKIHFMFIKKTDISTRGRDLKLKKKKQEKMKEI